MRYTSESDRFFFRGIPQFFAHFMRYTSGFGISFHEVYLNFRWFSYEVYIVFWQFFP